MTGCPCWACVSPTWGPLDGHPIVCPDCGSKRCPKATSHSEACTASNEPGQRGSRYHNAWAPETCHCTDCEPSTTEAS